MKKLITSAVAVLAIALVFPAGAEATTSPTSIDGAKAIDATQAKSLFEVGAIFIDVRNDQDFAAGHVANAIHIPLGDFNKKPFEQQFRKDQRIVIYSDGHESMESSRAVKKAVRWGYTNIHYYRDGFPSWRKSGYPVAGGSYRSSATVYSPKTVEGANTANAQQVKKLFDMGAVFIDVRKPKDFAAGRVPDAIHIPLEEFTRKRLKSQFEKDQRIVIYSNGHRSLLSSEAAALLGKWRYTNIYYFRDGFPAWKKSGYPVE